MILKRSRWSLPVNAVEKPERTIEITTQVRRRWESLFGCIGSRHTPCAARIMWARDSVAGFW